MFGWVCLLSANMFGLVCLQICLVWCVCKYVWFGVYANMFGLVGMQICLVWCVCKYVWFGGSANIGTANLKKIKYEEIYGKIEYKKD